jgi:hAT family C-terminal dimerisation region
MLNNQLQHFTIDVPQHEKFQKWSNLSELCRALVETKKCDNYSMVDRLLRLLLTLPVSTASAERAFSAMKIDKTRLRNRMEDDFLADNLVVYIEKEIAGSFIIEEIIEEFKSLKNRRTDL